MSIDELNAAGAARADCQRESSAQAGARVVSEVWALPIGGPSGVPRVGVAEVLRRDDDD